MECKPLIAQLEGINNKFIETKTVTEDIQAPLNQFIEQLRKIGKPNTTRALNLPEFYFYHATRVLRLLLSKARDRFAQAGLRKENPAVAVDFKALMPRINDLCTAIETNGQPGTDEKINMRVLEKLTDILYEEALDRGFMVTPDQEMEMDEISGEDMKDLFSLVQ